MNSFNQDEFEDTKGVISQHNGKQKNKRTNNDQQTLHINLMIELYEPHSNLGANSCAPEGLSIPVPLVTPVVDLDTNPVISH
jgi:hypothetical protein